MKIYTSFLLCLLSISLVAQFETINKLPSVNPSNLESAKVDWLIDASPYKAKISKSSDSQSILLHNGLISREIHINQTAASISLRNLISGEEILRGVKPEGILSIDGKEYEIGGLKGQPNYAFFKKEWLNEMYVDSNTLTLVGLETGKPKADFEWKRVRPSDETLNWPPQGVYLRLDFSIPQRDILVSVHYELYDGIPVYCKWLSVHNKEVDSIIVNRFVNELLAAVEYESRVEDRGATFPPPNIHVETDYAFGGMTISNSNLKSVHWEKDPDYSSQVNYLRNTPCLLKTYPELGPEQSIGPNQTFTSFKTYVLPFDGYDRERNGLALRKMYRTIAPWTTENPLMMHVRFADWESVKNAIDQCAEIGFEMVILTFGSGFNNEDDDPEYLAKMKQYADYAKSKGVEIGGYSLLASRKIGNGQDVVMPEGMRPTYNNSPCLESEWGQAYFQKLYNFYDQTGFSLLEHDGNYPGDECLATHHPGHKGHLDSRWNQWRQITDFYKWCRSNGVYLNVPDYYYLTGSSKCGMGYREVNWSLPRAEQVIHTRQNIFDGTWQKTPSMGWMFVPLTEYHGGGAAATIEPLKDHLPHYELMLMSNLGAGVQACYRGPRLYDAPETAQLLKDKINWYKKHRAILESDLIHLKRADGRNLDYWLHANPDLEEKGALMVFNPLNKNVKKNLKIPLYYTGLSDKVQIYENDNLLGEQSLNRQYEIELEVEIPANGYVCYIFK